MKKILTAPWRLFVWLYESHPKQTIAGMLLLVALSAAASGYANVALGQANARNAVTSCENSNESRAAARTLWSFVLDVSIAGKADPSPTREAFASDFRAYINEVYQPHDCSRLDLKYELPDPPVIPAPQS